MRLIISDSSPLISFDLAGFLSVIRSLYGTIIVPPAVREEIGHIFDPEWMQVRAPQLVVDLRNSLHAGEAEAIVLAIELRAEQNTYLLIDDLAGRKTAEFFGLNFTGGLGVLVQAKHAGVIAWVSPVIDALVAVGGRYKEAVVQQILEQAGELP